MKTAFSFALAIVACVGVTANAATLSVVKGGTNNDVYSVYLNLDGDEADSVDVKIDADAGSAWSNPDAGFNGFFPRTAGEDFTFINQLLAANPAQGGQGWSVLGAEFTADTVRFGGGPLGALIDSGADLFLANIYAPQPNKGLATVQVIRGGNVIEELQKPVGIPEPATLVLAGMGLIGLVAARRRMA